MKEVVFEISQDSDKSYRATCQKGGKHLHQGGELGKTARQHQTSGSSLFSGSIQSSSNPPPFRPRRNTGPAMIPGPAAFFGNASSGAPIARSRFMTPRNATIGIGVSVLAGSAMLSHGLWIWIGARSPCPPSVSCGASPTWGKANRGPNRARSTMNRLPCIAG